MNGKGRRMIKQEKSQCQSKQRTENFRNESLDNKVEKETEDG